MADGDDTEQAIEVHLDTLLAERGMTLTELSELVGITLVNLSVLKNDTPAPSGSAPWPPSAMPLGASQVTS